MPRKGYSGITVSTEVKDRLQKIADETRRTVPKVIEYMLDEIHPQKEG